MTRAVYESHTKVTILQIRIRIVCNPNWVTGHTRVNNLQGYYQQDLSLRLHYKSYPSYQLRITMVIIVGQEMCLGLCLVLTHIFHSVVMAAAYKGRSTLSITTTV